MCEKEKALCELLTECFPLSFQLSCHIIVKGGDLFLFQSVGHINIDNPCGQEVRGAPSSGWGFHPRSGMYLLNVYSIFKVREVFALTNQLGNFFRFVRSFFEIFQKNFFDHLSGIKKAPITSQRCNRGRNRKSPLTEISGLKSYEIIVCYRNLSAIAKFQTHFWRKLGVNWRKLWRKHRQF